MSQFFISHGQSIGTSASASVLPMNIQDWFPLGLTGLISLLSKEFSRVFSSTTIWKHQLFSAQSSLWSSSHLYMATGKTTTLTLHLCQESNVLLITFLLFFYFKFYFIIFIFLFFLFFLFLSYCTRAFLYYSFNFYFCSLLLTFF